MCDSQSNVKTSLMLAKLKQVGKSVAAVAAVTAMACGEPLAKSSDNMKTELKKIDPRSLLVDPSSKEKLAGYVKNIATDIDAILSITSQMGNDSDNLIKELMEVVLKAAITPPPITPAPITPPSEPSLIPLVSVNPINMIIEEVVESDPIPIIPPSDTPVPISNPPSNYIYTISKDKNIVYKNKGYVFIKKQ
jgi:hypothetical protein